MKDDDFAERLAAPTPTPGGGAAAARVGRYAAALLRMVTGITLAKMSQTPGAEGSQEPIQAAAARCEELSSIFAILEEADMAAFEAYLNALRLPRATDAEKAARTKARLEAAWRATEVPLELMEAARGVLLQAEALLELSRSTPLKAESDVGAALELALAAARAAELNVRVNLPALAPEKAEKARQERTRLELEIEALYGRLRGEMLRKLPV